MIDYKLILSDKESVKYELSKKNFDTFIIDDIERELLGIKFLKTELNELNHKRNAVNRDESVPADEKRELRNRISILGKQIGEAESRVNEMLLITPNFPDRKAPVGKNETENIVVTEATEYHQCEAVRPQPHWELGEALGILDSGLASSMSGSKFGLFKGKGAKLLRALVSYCMTLFEEKYFEMLPPHMVTTKTLTYTGHLPKFASEQYKCSEDDLWLIPTAEVPLTAAFAEKCFPPGTLPNYCMGYTLAFRREAGSDGKDTRGLQRIHEFHKVELLKIVEPPMVDAELDDLLVDCLRIIKDLELRYRVVDLCTGDMGDKYARCFDIEVYSPGIRKWVEVSSVGHFSDYQARRAGIRYVDKNGRKKLAYTMNGSGIATPRVWAAIIETYQQPDGSVKVPEALAPFMGCNTIN